MATASPGQLQQQKGEDKTCSSELSDRGVCSWEKRGVDADEKCILKGSPRKKKLDGVERLVGWGSGSLNFKIENYLNRVDELSLEDLGMFLVKYFMIMIYTWNLISLKIIGALDTRRQLDDTFGHHRKAINNIIQQDSNNIKQ